MEISHDALARTIRGPPFARRPQPLWSKWLSQGAAYETVPKRLPFEYENLGERRVKGFEQPVRVYAVSLKPGGAIPESEAAARLDSVADELLRLIPRYTLRALRKNPVFVHPDLIDKLVESIRRAGLPE